MPKYRPAGTHGSSAIVLGVIAIIGGISSGEMGFVGIGIAAIIIGCFMGG